MKSALSTILFVSIVVVSACKGSQAVPGSTVASATAGTAGGPTGTSSDLSPPPPRKVGTCSPSSVSQNVACPSRTVPPSNASSDYGCKSDADCKAGRDGRCVKNERGTYGFAPSPVTPEAHRGNFLAGPMAPPPRTVCAYDKCQSDKDCGPRERCTCGKGTGQDRNGCVALDTCLSDKDCGDSALCACGTAPAANTCQPGNCRSNDDCGGFACEQYCRSARDACRTHADCKAPAGMYPVCAYLPETRAFGCRSVPPPPAG